eukprot:gnl/MRDRNA2_/MRDRNA2_119322_c0_seq1.p1 gnl/MRDRNA2_/MRDRNA2_119322_c0~~gnl/MRDRNA2_/MRDRNA2_119322_c0_seq1.p1  ORF type:complete len:685 (+),score=104.75 gnl/MRDRNA2_/MRDRNA2_119322_c0_seq1:194-2056(+)
MAANWARRSGIAMHIHVLDSQWRQVFVGNAEPIHFDMPEGVRSISIQEGLFQCSYAVYRDFEVRDLHLDVGYDWQTAYLSPNEGGSGNATPMFIDFLFVLLGWSALRDVAKEVPINDNSTGFLKPTTVKDEFWCGTPRVSQGLSAYDEIMAWAKRGLDDRSTSREDLERYMVAFQRNFLGGKKRDLEALCTGGGTRSINLAFESVLQRCKDERDKVTPFKNSSVRVLTGNPHLAVERAQRRFNFQLLRLDVEGAISVDRLKEEIVDPAVVAVYAQTLSYTDGITDPLPEIVEVVEAENRKRTENKVQPVTIINDSCLAFCVLLHNDGTNGQPSYRLLDIMKDCITPHLVTLDAHKHLGTDKGVSTVVGSPGTLSRLEGHVKVGHQPSAGELLRALADMMLVGVDGYNSLYYELNIALENASKTIESNGMTIVHSRNKIKGSTVLACEDPSAAMTGRLKKLGHSFALLFNLRPSDPNHCQMGWSLSMTPRVLRKIRDDKTALDVFVDDLVMVRKKFEAKPPSKLAKLFRENSLLAILLRGGVVDSWIFSLISRPGWTRDLGQVMVRRFFTALVDNGNTCSKRRQEPLKELTRRIGAFAIVLVLILMRAMRSARRKSLKAAL